MPFHVRGALAESEGETIRERVTAGMATAKRGGRHVGRPARWGRATRCTLFDRGKTWAEDCAVFDIGEATLSRSLRKYLRKTFGAFRAKDAAERA